MLRFVDSIKKKYVERQLNREKQWPPTRRDTMINLQLFETNKLDGFTGERTNVKKTPIRYGDLFKVKEGKKPVNRVLVEGHAGIGKTILTLMLSEEWAMGKILQQFSCVLLLPLREKKIASSTSVLDLLKVHHNSERIRTSVAEELEENEGEGVLIIADGWDELQDAQRSEDSFLYDLLFGNVLPSASVLLTSRPSASASLHQLPSVKSVVEIMGLNEENIAEYIISEFEKDPEDASRLLQHLYNNPLLFSICNVPLNCAILCHLWRTLKQELPSTLTELYTQIILSVIFRDIQKKYPGCTKSKFFKSFNSIPSELQSSWHRTCEFAFEALLKNQIIFSNEELAAFFPEAVDTDQELPCFGLLQSTEKVILVGYSLSLHFLHLTFQEYLAAFHLTSLSTEEQLKFCDTYARSSRFNIVWRFFFGLDIGRRNSGNCEDRSVIGCLDSVMVKRFLSAVAGTPGVGILLCHCAFESKSAAFASEVANTKGENIFRSNFRGRVRTPHDYVAVTHVLSHSSSCSSLCIALSGCSVGDKDIERLVEPLSSARGNLQVTRLNLSENNLTNKGILDLSRRASPALSSLQVLDLHNNKIGMDGLNSILSVVSQTSRKSNKLRELNLSGNPLGLSGVNALASAVLADTLPKLRKLCLSNIFTDQADTNSTHLVALIEAISSHSRYLIELDLSKNKLAPPVVRALGGILPPLIGKIGQFTLVLDETQLGDEGVIAFTNGIAQTCKVTRLCLRNNDIRAKGLSSLMSSLSMGALNVHNLELDDNPLGWDGSIKVLEALSNVNENCLLQSLSLRNCSLASTPFTDTKSHESAVIGDCSAQDLSHLTPNSTIRSLHLVLSDNNFSGDCACVLAGYINICRSLTHLDCCRCQLNSDDMKQLLTQLTHLKRIQSTDNSLKLLSWNLSDNNIDDEGVAALIEQLSSLYPTLDDVSFSNGNHVSDGMLKRLWENLKVHDKQNRATLLAESKMSLGELMARGRAIHAEAEAKKMARRSQVLAEWKKYSLPPLDDKLHTEFIKMWGELLKNLCDLAEGYFKGSASQFPSAVIPEITSNAAPPSPSAVIPEITSSAAPPSPSAVIPEITSNAAPPSPSAVIPEITSSAAPPSPSAVIPEITSSAAPPSPSVVIPEITSSAAPPSPSVVIPEITSSAAPPSPSAVIPEITSSAAPPSPLVVIPQITGNAAPPSPSAVIPEITSSAAPPSPSAVIPEITSSAAPPSPFNRETTRDSSAMDEHLQTTPEENDECQSLKAVEPNPLTDSSMSLPTPSSRPKAQKVSSQDTPHTTLDSLQSQELKKDVRDIDIDSVDSITRLDDDDYTDISDELRGLESKYYKLGRSLHLTSGTVDKIRADNPHDCGTALVHVVDEWLKMNYSYSKFGRPSWQLLVKAVETVDHERAQQIARKHT